MRCYRNDQLLNFRRLNNSFKSFKHNEMEHPLWYLDLVLRISHQHHRHSRNRIAILTTHLDRLSTIRQLGYQTTNISSQCISVSFVSCNVFFFLQVWTLPTIYFEFPPSTNFYRQRQICYLLFDNQLFSNYPIDFMPTFDSSIFICRLYSSSALLNHFTATSNSTIILLFSVDVFNTTLLPLPSSSNHTP